MIALPTAYTARNTAISNSQIPEELQLVVSIAIATSVANGKFNVDIALSYQEASYHAQIVSWLKSLGYFVDYTDTPNQTGNIEVRWS